MTRLPSHVQKLVAEIETERRRQQTLVDRQLAYAAGGIRQRFCDVIDSELNAGVEQSCADPAPISSRPLPLENPFLCSNRVTGQSEYGTADNYQRREADSHENQNALHRKTCFWQRIGAGVRGRCTPRLIVVREPGAVRRPRCHKPPVLPGDSG